MALGLLACVLPPPAAHAGLDEWTTAGPEGGFITVLAVDPHTPTTLYAGTFGGGVFKSPDMGTT